MTDVDGGVCATPGIVAGGVKAGLKASGKLDLAIVAAREPVTAAAVLTRNQVKAAPILLTERHLADGRARAVLLNAGSANVCTGEAGERLAAEAAATAGAALGCDASDVLVASTGVIGLPVPRDPYLEGIPRVVAAASRHGHADAAQAILTTDLVTKEAAVRVSDGDGSCTIGGMAKGSGMIAPSMATMLAVITTDAPFEPTVLKAVLEQAVARTFNRITVDGSMSTNDMVAVLATGTAEHPPVLRTFTRGLTEVCARLAEAVVRDGEGTTRVLRIHVAGARSEADALAVARQVGNDLLVKAAAFGADPNWGRVIAAVGAAPVEINPRRITITFNHLTVCRFGVAAHFDRGQATAAMGHATVDLGVDLGMGDASATVLASDLSYDYVRINAEYTT